MGERVRGKEDTYRGSTTEKCTHNTGVNDYCWNSSCVMKQV